jgi:hypothetical protein
VLAIAPGNLLDQDATISAVDTSLTIEQENQKTPQGNELEAALGEMIVPRRRLVAPRTDGHRVDAWSDVYFDTFLVGSEAGVLVDEPAMVMALV